MDALVRTAPPPGSARPGDLYIDQQTRTLWLGVDPAVDPTEFLLISDIVAFQAEIEGCLADANAYTDTRILTRAPTVHNHTSAQITDLTAAVQAIVSAMPGTSINPGTIVMFSGSLAEVGVGVWAGWALCDGSNGTPNLRDKFVMGAGNKAVGSVNPQAAAATSGGGTHDHNIAQTALAIEQLPAHNHGANTGYVSHDHAHHLSGVTDAQGNHSHNNVTAGSNADNGDPGPYVTTAGSQYNGDRQIGYAQAAGNHQHNLAAWTGGINTNHYHGIPTQGSGQGHTHAVIGGGGIHEHSVTSAQLRDSLPYFALAFIMKL